MEKIYIVEQMVISSREPNGKKIKFTDTHYEPLFACETYEEAKDDIDMLQKMNEENGCEAYFHIEEITLYNLK